MEGSRKSERQQNGDDSSIITALGYIFICKILNEIDSANWNLVLSP